MSLTALWVGASWATGPETLPPPVTPAPEPTPGSPVEPGAPPTGPSVGGSGLVVRLMADPAPSAPVVVQLSTAGKAAVESTLHDDGKDPDVTGGDGVFSGSAFAEGNEFTVTVKAAGSLLGSTEVKWDAADAQRDLTLTWAGGVLKGEAGVSMPAPANGDASPTPGSPTPGSPTPASPPPGGPGGQPAGAPGQAPSGPGGVNSSADATWYLVFGGALLAAAGLGYFWFRSRGAAEPTALPPGVARLAERGLFGPGTPPASGGPSGWVLPSGPEAVAGLLGALAERRRVLVVAPEDLALPEVAGGPVHRIAPGNTEAILDAADELLGGDSGGAVLWLAPLPEGKAREALLGELPRGVGLLAAAGGADPTWPTATLLQDDGWLIECGAVRRALRRGPGGFSEA
jgi:hypothetical protein